ncbi:acyl-CoA synthetase, AMP-(fatty) acid ligase [Sulfuriferula multivorans]|uniref:Long-chain-fatty-acid--CoA ligase n=1 Tax=Sulfuriferula multivorans TaxID=1559896 RepID=A0A401JFR0_9PROT|nr:AMP-binding protein [Sulfuriferula multivorans]GBL46471.1 acyl-CoA synthetase, AMP-(fatty) acid ligase [Sulfuriferula multivorans]
MSRFPLVSHVSPDSIIAWRTEGAVTLRQFLTEVSQLAARFPARGHLLNMCSDRYRFSVGLAAAIVTGKVSLLPSTHTPETVRQIKVFAPDVFCLTDSDLCTVDLPLLRYPVMSGSQAEAFAIPQIDASQRIAVVFTSGSTGTPQPHPKTWGALVSSVQAEAARLGLLHNIPHTLIGTVPPQHMYGFESTVLMAWHSGNALSHAQPFYPADICQALAAVPTPRVLVSSPVHLRALLDAELALPELALVVSATAPLSAQLAQDVEARCHAPLMEIYGSTETGLIATRRPAQSEEWRLLPGIKLIADGDSVCACGGHIETMIAMGDMLEPVSDEHFLLHGRLADLVNIAGKRHSLTSLNHLLNSIPGVVDGAFYMPDESGNGHITRLAAFVVAPGLQAPRLLAALREHIDPVFLPRPLLFVEELPRNRTGKLPRAALQALFQAHAAQKSA